MRKLQAITSLLLFAAPVPAAHARKPSSKGDWQAVENLNGGTAISVKSRHSVHLLCYFEQATDDELFCEPFEPGFLRTPRWPYPGPYPHPLPSPPAEYIFKRATIREVRLEHSEGTNHFIGAGIGGAVGAGIGAARFDSARGAGALIFGLAGMAIGGAVGRVHPLFHRKIIYRR